jgi:hypothetical protein
MNIWVSKQVVNLCKIKKTNRLTSIYECNFTAQWPQTCFDNNVAIFRGVRKGKQIYLQCVRISPQYFFVLYSSVVWWTHITATEGRLLFKQFLFCILDGISGFGLLDVQQFDKFPVPCFCLVDTYLLTPWSRVLLEKLTGLQLVKKFTAFYGTRKFITALTSARHLSLSWGSPYRLLTFQVLNLMSRWRLLRDASPRKPPPGDPCGGVV